MMDEALEVRIVLPANAVASAFRKLTHFTDSTDEYTFLEADEDGMNDNRELYFESNGTLVYAIAIDDDNTHSDGGVIRFRLTIGGSLQNSNRLLETEELQNLIVAVREFYGVTADFPRAVYGMEQYQNVQAPVDSGSLPPTERNFITWLDIYPPEEAETIGRDKLLSAPAPVVEELDDGGVLIASKHPVTSAPTQLDNVAEHVGIPSWEDYPNERASRSDFEE